MPRVVLYTTGWCGFCVRARMLLEQRGIPYREVSLEDEPQFRQVVYDIGRQWTVPLVVCEMLPEPVSMQPYLWNAAPARLL